MNENLILQGLIEIGISLVTGFLVFFISLKLFMLLTRKLDETAELKNNNVAVAFVLLAFVLSLMLIVNEAVSPSMDTLRVLLEKEGAGGSDILLALVRIFVTYLVSGLVALVVLWLSISLYTGLTTKVDEMAELKKNNLAVGIVFGTFIFSAGLITREPLTTILTAFVAPPELAYTEVTRQFVNTATLLQGLIELPIALIGAVVIFILGVKLSDLMTRKIDETSELKRNNTAVAIYTASMVLSVMFLIQSSLSPAYMVLGRILGEASISAGEVLLAIVRILIFFIATALLALLLIRLTLFVFMLFTRKIDEMAELKKNNTAVALILAVLTISIAIMVANGITLLLEGFAETRQAASSIPTIRIK